MVNLNLEELAPEREELEELIVELGEEGRPPSEIGLVLRDQYGVPDVKEALGQKLSAFLEQRGLSEEVPEDLADLVSRAENIRSHLDENPGDLSAKRGLSTLEARVRSLADYYKENGDLPADWVYSPGEKAGEG